MWSRLTRSCWAASTWQKFTTCSSLLSVSVLQHRAFRRSISATEVTVSSIGEVANAIGAAILVFHSLLPAHFTSRRVSFRIGARQPASAFN